MLWTLLCLIILVLVIWYWLANIRCREFALAQAKIVCQNYGWTLLDESVAMIAWRPVPSSTTRFCVRRIYEFEYTRSGTERGFARITLLGHNLVSNANQTSNATADHHDDSVISLARYQKSRNDDEINRD